VTRIGQSRIEWALFAVIAAVCLILSILQYRWTGELSRAEPALLRAGLNDQLRRLSEAFSNDIRENCTALVPSVQEIGQDGTVEALRRRYQSWAAGHARDLFLRVGFAVAERGDVTLYGIDKSGAVQPTEWPGDWNELHSQMAASVNGAGRPPNVRPESNLLQMPVFEASGRERGWMIFEINEAYVVRKVLPQLISEYLNPIEPVYDVSVSRATADGKVIFSTREDHGGVTQGADATAGLFSFQVGAVPGRGRGSFRAQSGPSRWIVAVRHRVGSLDAAVASARRRNLIASLILVALMGGMAWALVQFTGRSRRLADMQFRFAAGVSHDLRTPLTAIRGAAFNLLEGVVKEPSAVTRYLRLILRNAEDLTAMIENVLAFSASMHVHRQRRLEAIDVGEVLRRAITAMTPEIEQEDCRIEVKIADGLPPAAGDPIAVELVFRNLIGNAVRHGIGGKWIGVSAGMASDGVEVRVCDHGPGIPECEQERIFEPFYRGEQARAQRVPGAGLGLSLVKNTIECYKGTVQVVNSSDGGAQFTVRLPALQEAL
jgi:signal transduction histidine kinase